MKLTASRSACRCLGALTWIYWQLLAFSRFLDTLDSVHHGGSRHQFVRNNKASSLQLPSCSETIENVTSMPPVQPYQACRHPTSRKVPLHNLTTTILPYVPTLRSADLKSKSTIHKGLGNHGRRGRPSTLRIPSKEGRILRW